jgi:hypothetical protein
LRLYSSKAVSGKIGAPLHVAGDACLGGLGQLEGMLNHQAAKNAHAWEHQHLYCMLAFAPAALSMTGFAGAQLTRQPKGSLMT